ncbi:hypothetical protein V4B17_05080 [Bartonella sp. B23]
MQALSSSFSEIHFCPTSGITQKIPLNGSDFLMLSASLVLR